MSSCCQVRTTWTTPSSGGSWPQGADLDRVTHISAAIGSDGTEAPFTIPGDLGALETLIGQLGAALVIVDVLNEYLDEKVDGHKDQSVQTGAAPDEADGDQDQGPASSCSATCGRRAAPRPSTAVGALSVLSGPLGPAGRWLSTRGRDHQSPGRREDEPRRTKPRAQTFKLLPHDILPLRPGPLDGRSGSGRG